MDNKKISDTNSQTLIERFDTRISTHIGVIVAIIFGAVTILAFLEGKGFPPTGLNVWYLIGIELAVFPIAIVYCFSRAFHYSMAVEKIKDIAELHKWENYANDQALRAMPFPVKKVISFRQKVHSRELITIVIPLAYILWLLTIIAVLTLE